jgi:pimeloyl-ACP methyl ester carboxylesterase
MNVMREGTGQPLVLLHGLGHHAQAWRPVIDRLSDSFDVIACDLPGFGSSAPLDAAIDPTIPAYADAFAAWFAEQGIEHPHVAGNSMGGAIALELARRGDVASATAFSPAGFWSTPELWWCQCSSLGMIAYLPRPFAAPVVRLGRTRLGRIALLGQLFGHPTRVPSEEAAATLRDAAAAPAFRAALSAFGRYRYEPGPPADVPVTVAWGRYDWLLPCRLQAPRARRLLPEARHVTLGTGHVPYFDDPGAVEAVIRTTAGRPTRG